MSIEDPHLPLVTMLLCIHPRDVTRARLLISAHANANADANADADADEDGDGEDDPAHLNPHPSFQTDFFSM